MIINALKQYFYFMPKKLTPLAIAYDFDGTLARGNMQEYDFIPALKMTSKAFWNDVKTLAKEQEADEILAYMSTMINKAHQKRVPIRRSDFKTFGKSVTLFEGVPEWFDRVNDYGKVRDVKVQHFIISSGLREMIRGTAISKKFTEIYASGFMYDQHDVAMWPALAINYTTKTQYLFRINKGSLDLSDNTVINRFVSPSERPVPFENIVFVGDGETDIPCMRLVRDLGGHSIAVYDPNRRGASKKAQALVTEGRATIAASADYQTDSKIDVSIKAIIDKVSAQSRLREAKGSSAIKDRGDPAISSTPLPA